MTYLTSLCHTIRVVKRGQMLEAEARTLRPSPRPNRKLYFTEKIDAVKTLQSVMPSVL